VTDSSNELRYPRVPGRPPSRWRTIAVLSIGLWLFSEIVTVQASWAPSPLEYRMLSSRDGAIEFRVIHDLSAHVYPPGEQVQPPIYIPHRLTFQWWFTVDRLVPSIRKDQWPIRGLRDFPATTLPRSRVIQSWSAFLPWWLGTLPWLLSGVAGWVRNLLARHRAQQGLCTRCGYDLRASAGRCPECGTV